jgi:hypothetical protein
VVRSVRVRVGGLASFQSGFEGPWTTHWNLRSNGPIHALMTSHPWAEREQLIDFKHIHKTHSLPLVLPQNARHIRVHDNC